MSTQLEKPNTITQLPSLSLFYPCYNEEKNVETSITKALEVLPKYAQTYEVLIINDGSRDKTKELAENIAKINPRVKVITHEVNKGYGGALKTGFANAQYDWVFFTDGDLQFDLNQLANFLPHTQNYQVIIGYRKIRAEGKKRAFVVRIYKLMVDILFGLYVKDIDCAFKLIGREALTDINLESDGMFINAELLIKLKNKGYNFKQLPVDHFSRKHGRPTGSNLKVIIRGLKETFGFYLQSKFGR